MGNCCGAGGEPPGAKPLLEQPVPAPPCCGGAPAASAGEAASCCGPKGKPDYLLRFSMAIIGLAMAIHWGLPAGSLAGRAGMFPAACADLLGQMWWGVLAGIFFVGALARVPRDLVIGVLGPGGRFSGLLRAVAAGVLLDLCSHGILLVGMQLYRRGASLGQTAAFLIASPWNSISLTFILIAMIGLPWTLSFILLSAVVALSGGYFLDRCVRRGVLPPNPNAHTLPEDFRFWSSLAASWKGARLGPAFWKGVVVTGMGESRMILRWIFVGVILAATLRATVDTEHFQHLFGPSLPGLLLTLLATTVIEVCSEGSSPIAADLLLRAQAPGNAFAFLMAGVATDYTEIMALKETTRSWKTALFLPLATVPQTLLLSWMLNHFAGGH